MDLMAKLTKLADENPPASGVAEVEPPPDAGSTIAAAYGVMAGLRESRPAAHAHDGALLPDDRVLAFLFAGNARFTLVSKVTGARFTFRVREAREEGDSRFFVSVLTGSNNEEDYTFLGTIFDGRRYVHGRKSRVSPDAPSAKAFAWFAGALFARREVPKTVEVWHCGSCGRCGRALTVPSSIEVGIGPDCLEKMASGES